MSGPTEQLLIDGYNVLYRLARFAQARRRDFEASRVQLVQWVAPIHDTEGIRTTLVFDGKGEKLTAEHPLGPDGLVCLFAPAGLSADGVIEQMVVGSPQADRWAVVSEDRMVAEAVLVAGAEILSAAALEEWVGRAEARARRDAARRRRDEGEWGNKLKF